MAGQRKRRKKPRRHQQVAMSSGPSLHSPIARAQLYSLGNTLAGGTGRQKERERDWDQAQRPSASREHAEGGGRR